KLNRFHALLTKEGKGTLTNVSHWGKRTMAYKIKKKETGYYVVAEFAATGDLLPEYERAVKLDEGVLRFLVVEAAKEQPKPVVAAPARGRGRVRAVGAPEPGRPALRGAPVRRAGFAGPTGGRLVAADRGNDRRRQSRVARGERHQRQPARRGHERLYRARHG